jgi:3-deoxy-7-phosphoheptulonate synthase
MPEMKKPTRQKTVGWGASAPKADATRPAGGWATQQPTQDLNVRETVSLVAPRQVVEELPMTARANLTVVESRQTIKEILRGSDKRLLVIAGPCSIHDEAAAIEYATRLTRLRRQLGKRLYVVMRVYFEKPRTTIGWKGLLYDPHLNGSFAMDVGIRKARKLLLTITEMGMPAATEILDPIVPQYLADLITWGSIGARTTESQTHRQMASGLSMPVGFKNSTEGNLQVAIDAMRSARSAQSFLGIDHDGRTAIIRTRGNPWGHIILRGGRSGPNYGAESVAEATQALRAAGLPAAIMVDCSHANSGKRFREQEVVWRSVLSQRAGGNTALIGMLLESNLFEGNQPLPDDPSTLRYGVSITDECIGWEKTEELLHEAHRTLRG